MKEQTVQGLRPDIYQEEAILCDRNVVVSAGAVEGVEVTAVVVVSAISPEHALTRRRVSTTATIPAGRILFSMGLVGGG